MQTEGRQKQPLHAPAAHQSSPDDYPDIFHPLHSHTYYKLAPRKTIYSTVLSVHWNILNRDIYLRTICLINSHFHYCQRMILSRTVNICLLHYMGVYFVSTCNGSQCSMSFIYTFPAQFVIRFRSCHRL